MSTENTTQENETTEDNRETIKLPTVIFFTLGLIVPLWIVTLPLFWFLAYRDYKSPKGKPLFNTIDSLASSPAPKQTASQHYASLDKLAELKEKGILNEEEFSAEKAKILSKS